jgi:nucleoside-diphosphate-sugar epimerase
MKIVVTGGNGYIGARLTMFLSKMGHRVVPVCRSIEFQDSQWIDSMDSIVIGDITDEDVVYKIANINADVIIHLISLDHRQSELEPSHVNKVNVLSTWKLLHTCIPNGLKKFIYFSTAQVYGKVRNKVIDENYPLSPSNVYGLTHLLSEQICNYFNQISTCNILSVRLSNSYGSPVFPENNCWWLAINDMCKTAVENNEIRLLSDGSPLRDFIYFEDVCMAVKILIDFGDKTSENVYNLSSGVTYSIMEIAHLIKEEIFIKSGKIIDIIGPDGMIVSNSAAHNSGENKFIISNAKLMKLGFCPKYNISDGINGLLDYLKVETHGR